MFQSVLEQHEWRARRLGTGAGVSLLVHGGMIAVALIISTRVVTQDPEPQKEHVIYLAKAPPRGNPNPPAHQAVVQPKPKPKPRTQAVQMPSVIPQKPPTEVEPTDTKPQDDSDDDLPYDPNGKEDGLEGGTCISCVGIKDMPATVLEPTGEDVVPFSFGTMEPPKPISRAQIEYTREALAAHITGMLIARCTITREGEVENCKIIKGLPHMNEAVLQTLETWRYTPVVYQGKPIAVTYTFNVKLDLPR